MSAVARRTIPPKKSRNNRVVYILHFPFSNVACEPFERHASLRIRMVNGFRSWPVLLYVSHTSI